MIKIPGLDGLDALTAEEVIQRKLAPVGSPVVVMSDMKPPFELKISMQDIPSGACAFVAGSENQRAYADHQYGERKSYELPQKFVALQFYKKS